MCGIFTVFNYKGDVQVFRQRALYLSKKVRHRGPDWSGCIITGNNIFCHERLAIVGVDSGAQPITNEDKSIILTVNGEIYNYLKLKKNLKKAQPFTTQSDCEIILHLYREMGEKLLNLLDGQFAFVLYDKTTNRLIAARDPIGITTLYYGFDSKSPGTIYFASEMKSLNEDCDRILSFPPGNVYDSATGKITQWFEPIWWNEDRIPNTPVDYTLLRKKLVRAVRKRLMSEVPYGVLLSGGLDSSLIASIAVRETRKIQRKQFNGQPITSDTEDDDKSDDSYEDVITGEWGRLHSFSIGLLDKYNLNAEKIAELKFELVEIGTG